MPSDIGIESIDFLINDTLMTIDRIRNVPLFKIEFLFKNRTNEYLNFIDANKNLFSKCGINTDGKTYKDLSFLHDRIIGFKELVNQQLVKLNIKIKSIGNIKQVKELLLELNTKNKEYEAIKLDLEVLGNISPYENFIDFYRKEMFQQNRELFELSLQYLNQYMLEKRQEIIDALECWILLMSGDRKVISRIKNNFRNFDDFWKNISLVYPIWTSTILSYKNFIKGFFEKNNNNGRIYNYISKYKPVDLILSDESGMCTIHSIFPLLHISKRAVIVGDAKQLEPIVPISSSSAQIFEESNYKTIQNARKFSPITVSAFHRASGCDDGHFNQIGDSIILDEHRRCQDDIANLFLEVAKYKKVNIETLRLTGNRLEKFNKMGV